MKNVLFWLYTERKQKSVGDIEFMACVGFCTYCCVHCPCCFTFGVSCVVHEEYFRSLRFLAAALVPRCTSSFASVAAKQFRNNINNA